MSVIEQGAVKKDKRGVLSSEQRKAEHELYIKMQRETITKMETVITQKEMKMKILQKVSDKRKESWDYFLESVERKPEECKARFEKACQDKQETSAAIKVLSESRQPLQRELDKIEDVLNRYIWYKTILFKLSPSEWQKDQEENTFKTKDAQKQQESQPEITAVSKGVASGLTSGPEKTVSFIVNPMQPSCPSDTVVKEANAERDRDENEEKLEIYFSDPQQVMELSMELTDQVLFLIHNSTDVDKILEENIEITTNKMKEDDEKLIMQVNDMRDRIKEEEKKAATLKMMVQFHDLLKTEDQDFLLAALGRKVRAIYSSCADSHLTNLSTLGKLCSIEHRMTWLLQQIENIPEDMCKALWSIKDNERKNRLREEKLRLELEKQKEKLNKCMRRAHGDTKKVAGRQLRPRSKPVQQEVNITEEPVAATAEDVPYEDFFSEDYN